MVCEGGPLLVRAWMAQVAALKKRHGIEVIWVTSGAIASAVERTGFKPRGGKRTLDEKQALSAIGQPLIMDLYNVALGVSGLTGAQILLTYGDLAEPRRKANFTATLERLLKWKVTPILNENDVVATDEIKFGDNDSLSARVAVACKADRLVILTDVDGYYESDPRKNPRAKLIPRVAKVTPAILSALKPQGGTSRGTGGMYSKLRAAQEARVPTHLVKGDLPQVLLELAQGRPRGTLIGARA